MSVFGKLLKRARKRLAFSSVAATSVSSSSRNVHHEKPSLAASSLNEQRDLAAKYLDSEWYLAQNPDVATSGMSSTDHYFQFGWAEDRSPHPLVNLTWLKLRHPEIGAREPLVWFLQEGREAGAQLSPVYDDRYYRRHHKDVVASGHDPMWHFLTHGWKERRDAHWLFRDSEYLAVNPDVAEIFSFGAEHYVQYGVMEGRSPSNLFWPDWYLAQIGDVADGTLDPFYHFETVGWKQGLSPHPMFDSAWYARQVPHEEQGECGLGHYLRIGWRRDLSPHPLFDPHWYRHGAPDAWPNVSPLLHFLAVGDRQGRSAHPLFDPQYYAHSTPDLASSPFGPTLHYVSRGASEMRSPNPLFDAEHYVWNSADRVGAQSGGLVHFIKAAPGDARHPHPLFDSLAQAAQSAAVQDSRSLPLTDYMQFRSHLDPNLVGKGKTGIPKARPALLPAKRSKPTPRDVRISILVPIYNSPAEHLIRAIESVRCQTHENWELILVDDGSPSEDGRKIAYKYSKVDKRITFYPLAKNGGISRATNEALERADGKFVAMLDHDDVLTPDALAKMIDAIVMTGADAAYSDQAYVSAWNTLESMFFKPDFSPAMISGVMYLGHLLVVRREIAIEIGGFDPKFDKLQDFEFMLRFSERSKAIIHVPEVLYHWRMIPGSIAADANSKGRIEPLQARAVNAHFQRLGFPGKAEPHHTLAHRLTIKPAFGKAVVKPSVVFVVRGDRSPASVERTVQSCRKALPESRVQVLGKPTSLARTKKSSPIQNFVRQLADLVSRATEEIVIFVDPATSTSVKSWSNHVLMYLVDSSVAAAAPHLIDENERVLAAGSVIGSSGVIPAMRGLHASDDGHAGSLSCDRDVSALNGFVFAMRVDALKAIGGLDPIFTETSAAFADVTVRAAEKGLRTVAVAGAHVRLKGACFYALARDPIDDVLFRSKHEQLLAGGDPHYNPNFQPDGRFQN